MANTILHKRSDTASSAPSSGSLALGELALNTADGKVFMKKGDNSIVEVGSTPPASDILTLIKTVDGSGSGLDADLLDGHDTLFFAPQSDTYTKAEIASMHNTILSGIDWKEAVTNFADLATTHTSPEEGWTASVNAEDTVYRYNGSAWIALANGTVPLATAVIDGKLSSADFTKLGGIENGATADQTAAQILTAIKTVDGSSSGLDADLLGGYANNIILRGTGIYAGGYSFATTMDSSLIQGGLSRIYTQTGSPTGSYASGLTLKHSTSRGFQILGDHASDSKLYYRNTATDGTSWQQTHQVMLHIEVTTSTNIDTLVNPGMYTTASEITNHPGDKSYLTVQVQRTGLIIHQQVFNEHQLWLRRSQDGGSTWHSWVQI